jgi:hypothetical protein
MGSVRRSGRVAKDIRIVLIGTDASGRVFAEETQTVTLSRHGAGVISGHKLAPGGMLTLRYLGGNSEASLCLVGQMGEDILGYVYGVAFVDPNPDFWELKFPPPPKWHVDFDVPLQCTSCHSLEVVDQREIEAEFILRFCANCGMSPQWRRAEEGAAMGSAKALASGELLNRAVTSSPKPGSSGSNLPLGASTGHRRLTGIEIAMPEAPPPEPLPPAATAAVARTANRRRDMRTRSPPASGRMEGKRLPSAAISPRAASGSEAAKRMWQAPRLKRPCLTIPAPSRFSWLRSSVTP